MLFWFGCHSRIRTTGNGGSHFGAKPEGRPRAHGSQIRMVTVCGVLCAGHCSYLRDTVMAKRCSGLRLREVTGREFPEEREVWRKGSWSNSSNGTGLHRE
jgi:hypothetical protein